MIEQGIDALLRADSGLMALLGSGPQPVILQQTDALPALTYHVAAAHKEYILGGGGVVKKMFQFDAWSRINGAARTPR